MKKFFMSVLAVICLTFNFTGCPCTCGDFDYDEIIGLEAVLDKSSLESDGLLKVALAGTPKVKHNEKRPFKSCSVHITVVNNGDENAAITGLVSSTDNAYREWKYYDNSKQVLEITEISTSYDLKNGETVNDEIVFGVNKIEGYYIYVSFCLRDNGFVGEGNYHLYLK